MNREQLEEIRARAEKASKGPWKTGGDGLVWADRLGDPVSASTEPEDAEFIAHARTDVPALLDEIDRLTRELDTMREVAQGNKRHVAYLMSEMERVTCGTCGVGLKVAAGTWFHAGPSGDYRAPHSPEPVFAGAATAEGSAEGGTSKGSGVS